MAIRGHPEVVDADLADYFGSIPHSELLQSVARRIVDRRVLHAVELATGEIDPRDLRAQAARHGSNLREAAGKMLMDWLRDLDA